MDVVISSKAESLHIGFFKLKMQIEAMKYSMRNIHWLWVLLHCKAESLHFGLFRLKMQMVAIKYCMFSILELELVLG
jgi:hypothetical protein